jgi:hypothetical protein
MASAYAIQASCQAAKIEKLLKLQILIRQVRQLKSARRAPKTCNRSIVVRRTIIEQRSHGCCADTSARDVGKLHNCTAMSVNAAHRSRQLRAGFNRTDHGTSIASFRCQSMRTAVHRIEGRHWLKSGATTRLTHRASLAQPSRCRFFNACLFSPRPNRSGNGIAGEATIPTTRASTSLKQPRFENIAFRVRVATTEQSVTQFATNKGNLKCHI